jgi:hypothetical protein
MCKLTELTRRLSPAERRSLELMGRGSPRRQIPGRHAEKLIGLGLAELIFGEPGLTGGGRRALGRLAAGQLAVLSAPQGTQTGVAIAL